MTESPAIAYIIFNFTNQLSQDIMNSYKVVSETACVIFTNTVQGPETSITNSVKKGSTNDKVF